MKNEPYSVLLLYPDYMSGSFGHDTFWEAVDARTPVEAVHKARKACIETNTTNNGDCPIHEADDLHVLLVIKGSHYDIKP